MKITLNRDAIKQPCREIASLLQTSNSGMALLYFM